MYCPCCLRGCRCRGPFQARGNIGEGGLADLTEKDLRRFRGTNVVGDGLSCFVYRYRLPGGRAEFGMTYSPVRRTDQRRLDQTVMIDPGFLKRLPGLDWLSARLPCRHWAYLLECAVKRLIVMGRGWPMEAVERARELSARILKRNGLFDFKLPGPATVRWSRADEAGTCVVYTLPVVPRDAGFAEVWSVLYGKRSVPVGQRSNAAGGWADRLRLCLQRGSAADEFPVYILLRRDQNARFSVPGQAGAIKYEALNGLDLVFAVPADRLIKGFNASGVSLEQVDALSARRFDGSGRNRRSTTRSATCEQPQDHFWDIPLAWCRTLRRGRGCSSQTSRSPSCSSRSDCGRRPSVPTIRGRPSAGRRSSSRRSCESGSRSTGLNTRTRRADPSGRGPALATCLRHAARRWRTRPRPDTAIRAGS